MNVWIIQTAEPLQIDSDGLRPMRAMNLSNALIARGHKVIIWTSDFNHYTKAHRFGKTNSVVVNENLEIRLFGSRGYKGHKGLSRLFDHLQMGKNLKEMLGNQAKPDVAFIGYPPIETSWVSSKWFKERGVPYILDIKDEWPQIILREFPNPIKPLIKVMLWPYFHMMRVAFYGAAGITSVTSEFLNWCLIYAKRSIGEFDRVAPTTSDDLVFSESEISSAEKYWDDLGVYDDEKKRAYFVGTINHVYNFDPVIYAAKNSEIVFVIAGNGPQREKLLSETNEIPNILIPGWITAAQSFVLAKRSSFALAPFHERSDFDMNVTNKFYDAMRLGIPMITSTSGVAGKLLQKHNMGMVYSLNQVGDLHKTLQGLVSNPLRLTEMGHNARRTYEENFDYKRVYGELVDLLETLKSAHRK
jgi:glycosyltransferase involved in cell wall biosynthesis